MHRILTAAWEEFGLDVPLTMLNALEHPTDSGSQKMQHNLEAISCRVEIHGQPQKVKTKNSADLKRGAAPRPKSAEFFVFTLMVDELLRCEKQLFTSTLHLLGSRAGVCHSHCGGICYM